MRLILNVYYFLSHINLKCRLAHLLFTQDSTLLFAILQLYILYSLSSDNQPPTPTMDYARYNVSQKKAAPMNVVLSHNFVGKSIVFK